MKLKEKNDQDFLAGGAEIGALIRSIDWSSTSLGSPENWPAGLKESLRNLLSAASADADHYLLVVDDDSDMRSYLADIFGSRYKVKDATNGEEALRQLKKNPHALVVTDLVMPGMDGLELLKRIRAMPKTSSIPVILLSATASEEEKKQAFNIGVNDILTKPFNSAALLKVVEKHYDHSELKTFLRTGQNFIGEEERARLAAIVQSSDDAIIGKTLDGIVTSWNDAATRIFGYTAEEMIGESITVLIPPDRQDEEPRILEKLKKGEKIDHFETKRLTKNGQLLDVSLTISPIKDSRNQVIGASKIARNITRQKDSEIRSARLAAIVHSSDDAIIGKTLDGIITSWNDAATRIFGYTEKEMIGSSITRLIPEDRQDEEPRILEKLKRGEQVDHFETKRLTKSGELIDISLTISPIKDSDNNIIGASKIARDITRQKMKDQQLKESEERFRKLADEAPMWVVVTDENLNAVYCNYIFLRFLGLKNPAELQGRVWEKYVYPADREMVNSKLYDALATQNAFSFECRLLKPDTAEYQWVLLKGSPRFTDDKFVGYVITGIVIHEHKSLEAELEMRVAERTKELIAKNEELESQKIFVETILDATVDLIAVFDRDLNYVAVNKRTAEMYKTQTPLVGANLLEIFPQIRDSAFHTRLLRAFEGETIVDKSYRSPIVDRTFENYFLPLKHGAGAIEQVVVIGHDITDIVQSAERLQRANISLETKNKELEQRNNELASFSYIASHDLQEPLRKIRIFGKMVVEEEYNSLSAAGKDYLGRMIRASERMHNLIEALLEFSRTTTSKKVVEQRNIGELIREVLAELRETIEEKSATIEMDQMPDLYVIPFQFKQMLHNIISNSLKYSKPDQPPRIRISSGRVSAEQTGEKEAVKDMDYCRITVADNGIGFEPRYSEKVFELFQRLHGRSEYSGSGIGLAICRKIAGNHNGFIKAESELGKGTSIHVYIPC